MSAKKNGPSLAELQRDALLDQLKAVCNSALCIQVTGVPTAQSMIPEVEINRARRLIRRIEALNLRKERT